VVFCGWTQGGTPTIWTMAWTGLDGTLGNGGVDGWALEFQVVGPSAESGARTRLRASEPIDRRSWPAGVRIESVWCAPVSCQSNRTRRQWLDICSLDGDNGWNGGPEGASATRDCGGWTNQAERPNGPAPGGEGSRLADPPLPGRNPSQATDDATWLTSPMRGGGRGTQGLLARLPGSAQSARAGSGRGGRGNDPDRMRGVQPTELGGWPTRGLPGAWQRGPTTRLLHCGGAGTGAHGWPRQSHGVRADIGCYRSVGLRVVINAFATRTLSSPTQCARTRVAPTGAADLGWRGLIG